MSSHRGLCLQLYAASHCIKNLASYPDLKTEASTNFVNDAQHVMIFATRICIGRSSAYMFYPMGNPRNINLTINGEYIYIVYCVLIISGPWGKSKDIEAADPSTDQSAKVSKRSS